MSRSKAQRRKAKARRATDRSEPKHALQAITKQRQRTWPMRDLLQLGPERGGIDAVQFEAALEISGGFEIVTRSLGYHGCNFDSVGFLNNWDRDPWLKLSRRELRLATIYIAWAKDAITRWHTPPPTMVEWIDDVRPLAWHNVPLLMRALDLWAVHRDRFDPAVLTAAENALQISAIVPVVEQAISRAPLQSTATTPPAAPMMRATPGASHADFARSSPPGRRTR